MSIHPSPELGSLFEAALNEFENRVGTNLVQHQVFDKLLACESIQSILDILQEQTEHLRTSPGDDSTLMKWVKRTVHILHSLSTNEIVVSGVSLAFPPANVVFAGIAILISAIKDLDKSYDTLVDLFESFGSFLSRLDIYTKIPSTTAITQIIVKILAELLSTISLAIQQVKQGRLKKLGKKLLGENDREVEAILQRLDRLTLEEARMTGTTTLEVVYDLLKNMKMAMDDRSVLMDDIHRTLVDMQNVASNMNKLRRDELQGNVRRWLSPPDPSINHITARNVHHDGSAEWFIHGNTFQEWKRGTGSLLWVHGKPGSGKSILSSSIIEDLKKSRKAGLASIIFFYFDFKDESKKNAHGALSSLLTQLAALSDPYSEILSALYSEHDAGSKQPTDDELRESFRNMLAAPDQAPIYIVIDALDECPNSTGTPSPRENVLRLVEWIMELRYSNLWVSVTSRPERDIAAVLQPLASHTISLHNETGQKEDITNYINWFVNSDPKARKWRKQDKELVIEKLSERADGMFRWVFCQLDRLRRCIISRIRHALDELPETLDETYERTLLDIDKENWVYAHRLFQCLVVAHRPLGVEELAEFLAFEFEEGGTPIFQADCRPSDPRDVVLSTCSSLIAVVNDFGFAIVEFSHFSVKEYLTSTRIAEGRAPRYYTPPEPAHLLVTRACLSILLQLSDQITEERMKDFPLVEYAARYWVEHAKFGNALSQSGDMVNRLFNPRNPHFSAWTSIWDVDRTDRPRVARPPLFPFPRATPLYYSALFNFRSVAEWLVNMGLQNINPSCGYYGTPLHAASATGSLEVAQFLLMYRVDSNRVSDDHTLFYVASERGQVPQVCGSRGADINAINLNGETPLIVALRHGPMETLMETTNLLLCHGANPNSTGQYTPSPWVGWGMLPLSESPLCAALSRGRHDVAHLLQRHGADPNSQDDRGETLLHVAVRKQDTELVQVLLELGADINSRDNKGRTPLHVPQWETDGVVLLLLECGADPSVRDDNGQTPLHIASQYGSLRFARRLLELGVGVNSRDNKGRTPFHVIGRERGDVAQLLLEHGADPGVRDDDGQIPLHVASRKGMLEFARHLLEHGSDVNSRDNKGRTPLHVTQRRGDSVTLLLLEHGADPGVRDDVARYHYTWPHHREIWKLARWLLENGPDVNSHDNQGRTPLHAIEWEGEDVAPQLLKHSADPGVHDDAGQIPPCEAARSRSMEFARHLLKRGFDANSHDNQGRTPLHVIEWWGRAVRLPLLLLEGGADQGVRDNEVHTPPHAVARWGKLKVTKRLLELTGDTSTAHGSGSRMSHYYCRGVVQTPAFKTTMARHHCTRPHARET